MYYCNAFHHKMSPHKDIFHEFFSTNISFWRFLTNSHLYNLPRVKKISLSIHTTAWELDRKIHLYPKLKKGILGVSLKYLFKA